jgi:hypothetical protein
LDEILTPIAIESQSAIRLIHLQFFLRSVWLMINSLDESSGAAITWEFLSDGGVRFEHQARKKAYPRR